MKDKFKEYAIEYVEGINATKKEKEGSLKVLNFFIDYMFTDSKAIKIKDKATEFVNFVINESNEKIEKKEIKKPVLKKEDFKEVRYFLQGFIEFLKNKENE